MWKQLWQTHSGRIIGVAAGLFFGFIYLFAGFWDMLFFMLLVGTGYWIGRWKDIPAKNQLSWREWYEWLYDRWRWLK
jgi:uncharacterized membrane protein